MNGLRSPPHPWGTLEGRAVLNVLVVDDDEVILQGLVRILQRAGTAQLRRAACVSGGGRAGRAQGGQDVPARDEHVDGVVRIPLSPAPSNSCTAARRTHGKTVGGRYWEDTMARVITLIATGILVAALSSGCSPAKLLVYEPNPGGVKDPVEAFKLAVNTGKYPPVKMEITDTHITATWVGANAILTGTLVFAEVTRIELLQHDDDEFEAVVYDETGEPVWRYEVPKLSRAKNFIDALVALKTARKEP
jgi:hypothetical protein